MLFGGHFVVQREKVGGQSQPTNFVLFGVILTT